MRRTALCALTPLKGCVASRQRESFPVAKRTDEHTHPQSRLTTRQTRQVRHHFVAFVLSGGQLLELDGTKVRAALPPIATPASVPMPQ